MADSEKATRSTGVLICDDVASIRTLLSVIVGEDAAFTVLGEAKDGVEAVVEAERLQPDVILLDLSMPIRTGFDALPDLKRVAPGAKIIVFSGFAASTTIARDALAHGADRYLEKGVHPDVITQTIAEVAHSSADEAPSFVAT